MTGALRRRPRDRRRDERGYVAIVTALILIVLMSVSAFAVDVGHWYLEGQRLQRAADAAALAGVTKLPGDRAGAYATAATYAASNGESAATGATVASSLAGGSTRLRVDITDQVSNFFGPLLGVPTTTVSRHAIAEFAGPVPLGSPCNHFGDDPIPGSTVSSNCSGTGQFWANVGSPASNKQSGDAYQNNTCTSATSDGCGGNVNSDYDPNGHVFTITVRQAVNNLTIQAFDPAFVAVGDFCTLGAANLAGAKALPAAKTVVTDPATRYVDGTSSYCTGDQPFTTNAAVKTEFVVRGPAGNPWEPLAWPTLGGCTKQFTGYYGDLSKVLNTTTPEYAARPDVAQNFRQWVTLCTISGTVQPGTYAIQVHTNNLGADAEGGHNRFALRAYGGGASDKDNLSIAGFSKMVMYGNTPNGTSRFFLARIPSNSSGQFFNVNLFDIGDGATAGSTVKVIPPTETGGSFSNCTGKGVTAGSLPTCTISVSSIYNGRWQTITVPIPASYTCNDSAPSGCWVRLEFFYGPSSSPADTTSWNASLEGDPIRLVE